MIGKMSARQRVLLRWVLRHMLRATYDEKQSSGTQITIAQGVADFAQLAGVDDAGHVVGDGVDEGAETK